MAQSSCARVVTRETLMSPRLDFAPTFVPTVVALGCALFGLGGCYQVDKNFDDFVKRDTRQGEQ